jgi:putative transposase
MYVVVAAVHLGDLKVRSSRPLPSVPSSVTVIREPDSRYYASFVVERAPAPLPPVARSAGVDVGLAVFAAVAASDGSTELVPNPRYLRAAQRRLARAQRALSRKRKGSANRAKALPSGRGRPPQGPRPARRPPPQARPAADP